MSLRDFWDSELVWNTVGDWVLALLAFLITFTVVPLLKRYIAARRRRWAEQQIEPPVAIQLATLLVERTRRIFLWAVALYLAASQLEFPQQPTLARRLEHGVQIAIVLIFWFQVGLWAMAAARFAIERRQRAARADPALAGSIEIIFFVVGLVVWTMALLLALDNLGIAIKPLLAGLGIGDALAVDGFVGTVEHIGVKSTRLRSVSGEQIVMSNADVLKSRVRNFGRMSERRSAFELAVTYDTAPEVLRVIPAAVRTIIEAQPKTRFERCNLLTCGPTALQFEIVYFTLTADYQQYANTQQTVLIGILERFRELGVQFATPVLAPTPARAAVGSTPARSS